MAEYKEVSGYCYNCQKRVLARQEQASHTFWLLASVLTCGLFAIVWIVSMLIKSGEPAKCTICGSSVSTKLPATGNQVRGNVPLSTAIPPMKTSPSPLLIVGGIFVGLFIIGLVANLITSSLGSTQTEATTTPTQFTQPTNPAPLPKPSVAKSTKQNSAQEAQARKQWAAQYQIRQRSKGFANAKCTVSGKDNTTLTMRSEAVIFKEAIQTLQDSGHFDEVFAQGFTRLVLEDTAGHSIVLTK